MEEERPEVQVTSLRDRLDFRESRADFTWLEGHVVVISRRLGKLRSHYHCKATEFEFYSNGELYEVDEISSFQL